MGKENDALGGVLTFGELGFFFFKKKKSIKLSLMRRHEWPFCLKFKIATTPTTGFCTSFGFPSFHPHSKHSIKVFLFYFILYIYKI